MCLTTHFSAFNNNFIILNIIPAHHLFQFTELDHQCMGLLAVLFSSLCLIMSFSSLDVSLFINSLTSFLVKSFFVFVIIPHLPYNLHIITPKVKPITNTTNIHIKNSYLFIPAHLPHHHVLCFFHFSISLSLHSICSKSSFG